MTGREVIDFLPIIHAIPLVGIREGQQFFSDTGPANDRYGLRGIVPSLFGGNESISTEPHGFGKWKELSVSHFFFCSTVATAGNVEFWFDDREIAEFPPTDLVTMPEPFHRCTTPLKFRLVNNLQVLDEKDRRSGSPLIEVGATMHILDRITDLTRSRNYMWQRERGRSGRDFCVNRVMSVLQGLHLVASSTPMMICGFAGRAEVEFV